MQKGSRLMIDGVIVAALGLVGFLWSAPKMDYVRNPLVQIGAALSRDVAQQMQMYQYAYYGSVAAMVIGGLIFLSGIAGTVSRTEQGERPRPEPRVQQMPVVPRVVEPPAPPRAREPVGMETPSVDSARAPTAVSLGAEVRILEGVDAGRTFPLSKAVTTIGRFPDRDIRLTDEYASRKHATISFGAGRFILRNESSLGTLVNEVPANEIELHGGERIRMGRTVLEFVRR